MEQSSSFVQHHQFQLYLLRQEFQHDKLNQTDGEEGGRNMRKKNELWQNRNLQRWTCLHMFRQVPHPQISETQSCRETGKQDEKKFRDLKKRRVLKWSRKMYTLAGGWWMTARESLSQQRRIKVLREFSESESESWNVHEDEVTGFRKFRESWRWLTGKQDEMFPATGKLVATEDGSCVCGPFRNRNLESSRRRNDGETGCLWSHNLHTSPATGHHMEAVFSIVRKIYERGPDDPMDDLDVNMAIWCSFLNATLQAAGHLGQDHEANLRFVKNHLRNSVGQLFNETGKLISERTEITCVNTMNFTELAWMSTSLLCSNAFLYHQRQSLRLLFSAGKWDMILLRLGRAKFNGFRKNNHFEDTNRIDGMPTEFEWKIFPGITTLGLFEKSQSLMRDPQCEIEHFNDRTIFMSMYNDIAWHKKETQKNENKINRQFANFPAVIGLSWGLDQNCNGTGFTLTNPMGHGTKLHWIWWRISQNQVIQYFVPPVPLREED